MFCSFRSAFARKTPNSFWKKASKRTGKSTRFTAGFSESYRTLDAEKVVNLYTETAAYLQPNDDLLQGREQVREVFTPFFEKMKKDGLSITISFQIFQRAADKNLAYDVGIYTLRSFKDGKEVSAGGGKFGRRRQGKRRLVAGSG